MRLQLPAERQAYLLAQIERHGIVRVADAVTDLGVTGVTVRRDISALVDAGRVARVHGGAIAAADEEGSPERRQKAGGAD
ncbi:MAG: DeoR family transcriptional regulator, partial [Promicromonosporaceae bacterium]|nr:DeoR family transcriptional regulator [Promicromonosporaceae bacterium]